MSKEYKRYLVSAALPYANGPKHIGHLAGAYIPADVYARYLRSQGRDVVFVSGSDEHGTAIPNQALKEKTTSQAIIDKYHALIRDCFQKLGLSFDIYHRTSEPIHHKTSQEFFLLMHGKGLLTEETSEQYYDEEANVFLADRYIVGTCPRCGHTNAYGDQCEKCGSTLSPMELIEPRSTLSGKTPVLRPTLHWHLPLDRYENWLKEWILESHKSDWKANVYGQCKSWIDAGLQSRAMTRDLDWGIKVPLPGADGKVLYVWFDAPIGYISATRALFQEMAEGNRKFATPQRDFGNVDKEGWKKYWKDNDTKLVHFIGKDNIVFHCIIFPIMLHASGEYIVPDNVPANEFMNLEGDKMSTSRGWSIEMHEYLEDFSPTSRMCFGMHCSPTCRKQRTVSLPGKIFRRKITMSSSPYLEILSTVRWCLLRNISTIRFPCPGINLPSMKRQWQSCANFRCGLAASLEGYRFREATAHVMDLARLGNKYLAETEPWKLAKTDLPRVGTILNLALQIAANLAIVAEPFLPFTSKKLTAMLNMDTFNWASCRQQGTLLKEGHTLGEQKLLFDKIEDDVIAAQIKKLNDKKSKAMTLAAMPWRRTGQNRNFSSMTLFLKVDIRIGKILTAEPVEKSGEAFETSG